MVLEGEVKKAGKLSDTFSGKVGQGVGGAAGGLVGFFLGSPVTGARLGAAAGKKGGEKLGSKVGSKQHKKKVTNLLDLIDLSQGDKTNFRKILVEESFDVFQSFEMQFMRATTDQGPKYAMHKLAEDATNRAINYIKKKKDTSITEGVILGESKQGISSYLRVSKAGHTVVNVEKKWNTADLYKNTGIVITNSNGDKYYINRYEDKDGKYASKYGYRLLFQWELELWESKSHSYREYTKPSEKYKYILKSEQIEQKLNDVLKKINLDDKGLAEERNKKILEEVRDDIMEEIKALKGQSHGYAEDSKILANIETNLKNLKVDEYLKRFEQHFEEAKQERQEIAKSVDEVKQIVEETEKDVGEIKQGVQALLGKQQIKDKEPVWFDVRESVTSFTALTPGRQEQLDQIATSIQEGIVVISGLRGVGKSELAVKYARNNEHGQDNVIWINAKADDTIKDSLCRLLKELGRRTTEEGGNEKTIESMAKEVYNYFASKTSLFIFDNAEGYTAIEKILPLTLSPNVNKPHMLITSLKSEWEVTRGNIKALTLGDFDDIEAKTFIKKALQIDNDSQNEDIVNLSKKLHNFPLALQQAIAYIKKEDKKLKAVDPENEFKISDYLGEYDKKTADLLKSEVFQKIGSDYDKTTFTALQVALDKIKSDTGYGQQALEIINIMAYLASDNIPAKIFLELVGGDERKLGSIIQLLKQYSIVRQEGVLNIHGLVQQVRRLELKEQGEKVLEEKILENALKLLKKYIMIPGNAPSCVPHIISIWNYASKYDKLIEGFVVNNNDNKATTYTTHFHLIAEGSSYEVVNDVVSKIEHNHSNNLNEVINAESRGGGTPLHNAVLRGDEQIVKPLITKGANVDATKGHAWTPLHLATKNGYLNIVRDLLDNRASIDVQTEYKFTPLHLAARNGYLEVVKLLLERGADANAEDQHKFTPLHFAVKNGHIEVVNALLENDRVNVNAETEYKLTPLHFAARNGNINIIKALLNKGAIVNVLNQDHFTPLHLAVLGDHINVVNGLLKKEGIDINLQTIKDGIPNNTPLHLAAEKGYLDIVKVLMANGAKVDIKNKEGKVALDLAGEKNHLEVKDYITQHKQEVPSQVDQNQQLKFNRRHGAAGIGGQIYEIELSMLFLLQGIMKKEDKKIDSFHLATNMEEAGNFDDVVFKYKYHESGVEKSKIIFLQAKHKDDPEKGKMTVGKLLSKSKEEGFSLKKYFTSYREIKKQFSEKANHPIFQGKFEDLDCDFIIYTNALNGFNRNKISVEEIGIDQESILHLGESNHYYKLTSDWSKKKEVMDVLQCSPDCEQLEKGAIEKFFSKLKLFIDQPNERELGEMIKRKVQEIYQVEQRDIDSIFSDVEYRVRRWWQTGNDYLTESNRFFQDAIRILIRFDVKEPVVLFTGRGKELDELHNLLQGKGKVVISSQKMASVTGLGGIGKSELTRKYISEHSKDYDDNVVWINAENYQTIDKSFRRLAQDKLKINTKDIDGKKERDIESIIPEVYKFFAERHRKSLFIFDNAGKYRIYGEGNEGIDKFLPSGPNEPHILITSRDQEWGKDIKLLQLGVFTEEEAAEFIRKALNIEIWSQESEVKKLAETLQYFPLALQQAVAYIKKEGEVSNKWREERFTISSYLEQFKEKAKELLDESPGETHDQETSQKYDLYTGTVLTTWKITVDKIKQKKTRGGIQALEILDVIAYLAPDRIPIKEIFSKLISDEDVLHGAVELLDQYSMANLERGKLNIHRLVQQVTRIKLEEQNKEEDTVKKTFELLGKSFPYGSDASGDYSKKQQLLPHLEAFLSRMDDWLVERPKDRQKIEEGYLENLLVWMGDGYSDFKNPKRQKELLERALPILREHYKSDNFQVVTTLVNLGNAYGDLGDHHKEKELFEQALAIKKRHYGPDHFQVASTLGNLSNAYGSLGDPQKKKELLERVLLIFEKHYGPDHSQVAVALVNLGDAYGDLGYHQEQKELLERALTIQERHYGPDHLQVAIALENLGNAYGNLGNHRKQKELLEQALAIKEKHYGVDHFQVASTLVDLSNAYGGLGDPWKQKELLERALPIEERHYGHDHFQVAITLGNLGNAYGDLGDPQKKKELLERALSIEEKYYGHDHFQVTRALRNLSNAYGDLGDPRKKKELLERALPIEERHYGCAKKCIRNSW